MQILANRNNDNSKSNNILKNGSHDITGISENEEWFVSKIPYEKIVISGKILCYRFILSTLNSFF